MSDVLTILDIGSGIGNDGMMEAFLGIHEKKVKITRLDINPQVKPDIVHDITQPLPEELRGAFDLVWSCHMLEHMSRNEVFPVMRNMASAVKNTGEVWVIVPDIEWAANEIIHGKNNMAVQGIIFGAQRQDNAWDIHKSGFTLKDLRRMMEIVGLLIKKAYVSPFHVIMEDKQFPALQIVCVGARYDGLHEEKPQEEKEDVAIDLAK